MTIQKGIHSFSQRHILVIGDAMIDAYFIGSVDRISPEAPVPVISVVQKDQRPGGAANVALNLVSLGAKATLCSVIGADNEGRELKTLLQTEGIDTRGLMVDEKRPTTIKTRVIAANHHLLRIDHETTKAIPKKIEEAVIAFVESIITSVDAVILQDYNKGLLTKKVIERVIEICNSHNIPSIVDPKKDHFFTYKHCTLFKPNRKEIKEGLKTDKDLGEISNVEEAAAELMQKLECDNVMVTLSEDGVFIKSKFEQQHIKAHPRKIIDVSGAGDSVVSVAALCMASGMNISEIAALSNIAGGLVCEKVGVVPVKLNELLEESKTI